MIRTHKHEYLDRQARGQHDAQQQREERPARTQRILSAQTHTQPSIVGTHVLPSCCNDLFGSMITKLTHAAAQHLRRTFHDFFERRLLDIHGGNLSNTELCFGGDGA